MLFHSHRAVVLTLKMLLKTLKTNLLLAQRVRCKTALLCAQQAFINAIPDHPGMHGDLKNDSLRVVHFHWQPSTDNAHVLELSKNRSMVGGPVTPKI